MFDIFIRALFIGWGATVGVIIALMIFVVVGAIVDRADGAERKKKQKVNGRYNNYSSDSDG